MDGAPLTGRDGAQALFACMSLRGARFDARRVNAALRSRAGRLRLRAAITAARRHPPRLLFAPLRRVAFSGRRRRAARRLLRASPGRAAPARSTGPSPREEGS